MRVFHHVLQSTEMWSWKSWNAKMTIWWRHTLVLYIFRGSCYKHFRFQESLFFMKRFLFVIFFPFKSHESEMRRNQSQRLIILTIVYSHTLPVPSLSSHLLLKYLQTLPHASCFKSVFEIRAEWKSCECFQQSQFNSISMRQIDQ